MENLVNYECTKKEEWDSGEEEKGGKDMCLHKIETYGKFFFDQVNSKDFDKMILLSQ